MVWLPDSEKRLFMFSHYDTLKACDGRMDRQTPCCLHCEGPADQPRHCVNRESATSRARSSQICQSARNPL